MPSKNVQRRVSLPKSEERSSQTNLNKWLAGNKRMRRLWRWVFDRWVYSRRQKRCAFRRLMHFPREQKLQLRKRTAEKFSHKKVTRIERDVNAWGNTCGFRLTYEGLQTRTLCKTEAKCCIDYANLNFDLCVSKYVNQNLHSVMYDSIFWRNNCSDRKSARGYCNECREIVSKPDVEIDDTE